MGFRVGALMGKAYKLGDTILWSGGPCRPESAPAGGNIVSVGYFNCDNIRCSSWKDCFPDVQHALIVIKNNVVESVSADFNDDSGEQFRILEMS